MQSLGRIMGRFRGISLLPRSLAGRMFSVFCLTLLVFMGAALGSFYRFQFLQHVEETQDSAAALVEVAAQAVEDAVVIGDYDTVKRTLEKTLVQSPFNSASFIDVAGGVIRVQPPAGPVGYAPAWLRQRIGEKLYDVNRVASVGGKDYGVIRMSFDEQRIAGQLWTLLVQSACLAAVAFAVSLVLMRALLRRWMKNLGHLHAYEHDVTSGEVDTEGALFADAPLEIKEAVKAVNRTAASLRNRYGQRIDELMHSLVQHKSAMDEAAIVSEIDTAGRIMAVNDQFVRNSGLSRPLLLGRELFAVSAPCAPGQAPWSPEPRVWNGEVTVHGPAGTRQWHRTIVPILDAGGVLGKFICIDIDISERKEFEQTILENAKRQTLIAAFGRKALETTDVDGLFEAACATAAASLGAAFAAVFESRPHERALALRAGTGWPEDEIGKVFPDEPVPASAHAAPCPPALAACHGVRSGAGAAIVCRGRMFGTIAVFSKAGRSFSKDDEHLLESLANILATALERHDATSRLAWLAQNDPLTSLPNRRHLGTCIEHAIGQAQREQSRGCVMFIDLDGFKHVNDIMGHGVGDQLLVQASQRLKQCVRAGDVVARLGGDEFAVVLPRVRDPVDAAAVGAKLVEALALPFYLQGQQIFVSASIGVACYPQDGTTADALLKCADIAMYSAKNNGRNNYQFYAPEMNEKAAQRLLTENQLRVALERGEFLLHYQPKAELDGGRICGFEALLRWQHPQRGLVLPLEFIGILEDTGLITAVGEWVIAEVCRQLRHWQLAGLRPLPVSINLSARQLQQRDLDVTVERIVRAAGVDPRLLEFELTESMLMSDPEAAVATLSALKAQGMRLSVDDFGTGYSSLAYLKRFPLDALKIDRAFVRDLHGNPDDAAITNAVIRLAHSLNLQVVAEGVETVEQVRILEGYACDQIQGYHIGRPAPPEACARLLATQEVGRVMA